MSSKVSSKDSSFARILRTLKVRETKRALGRSLFSINAFVMESLNTTKCYISNSSDDPPYQLVKDVESESTRNVPTSAFSLISKARAIMRRLDCPLLPLLISSSNQSDDGRFISSYTSHSLPCIIFKSSSFSPPKIQIFKELVSKVTSDAPYEVKPIIFSYFQKDQLQSVNAFISYFFWPVDLSEYLQHPDFTVVVTYGTKLVIGCGFMTPDASISEAYIPFLLVHPDYQYAGIGRIILYHLIQSCQGKDVLLHVAVDNPSMLLYQKFGFKIEEFCIDFYEKYYPAKYHLAKHAFLMRLRR